MIGHPSDLLESSNLTRQVQAGIALAVCGISFSLLLFLLWPRSIQGIQTSDEIDFNLQRAKLVVSSRLDPSRSGVPVEADGQPLAMSARAAIVGAPSGARANHELAAHLDKTFVRVNAPEFQNRPLLSVATSLAGAGMAAQRPNAMIESQRKPIAGSLTNNQVGLPTPFASADGQRRLLSVSGAASLADASSPSRPRAFDASEGTPLDPLLNKTFDLNFSKTVPSLK
jgi:hypothetical protein